jgi:hypothetical protein
VPAIISKFTVEGRGSSSIPLSSHKDKPAIVLWVVHVVEDSPPEGDEGIEWFLLTTMNIESVEKAEKCLRWYCLRGE